MFNSEVCILHKWLLLCSIVDIHGHVRRWTLDLNHPWFSCFSSFVGKCVTWKADGHGFESHPRQLIQFFLEKKMLLGELYTATLFFCVLHCLALSFQASTGWVQITYTKPDKATKAPQPKHHTSWETNYVWNWRGRAGHWDQLKKSESSWDLNRGPSGYQSCILLLCLSVVLHCLASLVTKMSSVQIPAWFWFFQLIPMTWVYPFNYISTCTAMVINYLVNHCMCLYAHIHTYYVHGSCWCTCI